MKKKLFKQLKSQSGVTMIEVLVAIMVVMLMVALYSKVVTTSVQIYSKSEAIIQKTEQFDKNYYKTSERTNRHVVSGSGELSLSVDMDKTDSSNRAAATDFSLQRGSLLKYTDSVTGMTRYSIGISDENGD